jgi:hypothetical protein
VGQGAARAGRILQAVKERCGLLELFLGSLVVAQQPRHLPQLIQ